MSKNIKKLCMKLAKLALMHERFSFDIHGNMVTAMVAPKGSRGEVWEWEYYDNISFIESDAEERLGNALEYVRNLGGVNSEG